MRQHVPHLLRKLELLASAARNPTLVSVEAIRSYLGIAKSTFYKYTKHDIEKDRLPGESVEKLCDAFALPKITLLMDDIEAFKERVRDPTMLLRALMDATEIDESRLCILADGTRGISPASPPITAQGPVFPLFCEFRVRLQGPSAWHALLLCSSPDDLVCLTPPGGLERTFIFCEQTRAHYTARYRFDYPRGQHELVAIFTRVPLARDIVSTLDAYASVVRFENYARLCHSVAALAPIDKQVFRFPFVVS